MAWHLGWVRPGRRRFWWWQRLPVRCFSFQSAGCLIGWIGGLFFGFFGDYFLTISLSVAASLAGAVVIMSMDDTDRVLILDWEENLPPEARSAPAPSPSD